MEIIQYTDWNEMINELKQYVSTIGNFLEIKDDPRLLKLGYADPINNKWFVIRLAAFKKTHNQELDVSFTTEQGKLDMLKEINGLTGE